MNHYLWQNRRDPGDAMLYGAWPAGAPSMISGALQPPPAAGLLLPQNARSQGRLTDNLLLTGPGRVFSHRLLHLLQRCGVDNLQAFDCRIHNQVTGETVEGYAAVNVIGRVACVDAGRSEFEGFGDGSNRILIWEYLTLDPTAIPDLPMFVLAEMPVQIVVREDVKAAMEAAGISGVEFVSQGDHAFDPGQHPL